MHTLRHNAYAIMKFRTILALLSLLVTCAISTITTHAQVIGTVVEPPPPTPILAASQIIITASATGSSGPLFVQLYNNSDSVQDLHGWRLVYIANSADAEYELTLATFDVWLRPRGYAVIAAEGAVTGADSTYALPVDIAMQIAQLPTRAFRLEAPVDAQISPVVLAPTAVAPQWQERNKSSTTGKYLETYTVKTGSAQLVGGGLYVPLDDTAGLQIVEILANARSCSPLETALDCGDYVKLYNSSTLPIELSDYRLRTDSGGSKSSSSNTFSLHGQLAAGAYLTVRLKDNKEPLSITNDGGYVWIEDTYGVQVYEPVVSYPDTTSKQGQSWALDAQSATWKYMQPAPDTPNYWPPPEPVVLAANVTTVASNNLEDCGPGRERNQETNRCRTIVTAGPLSLTPCGPGQERNPETNRCRNVAVAATALIACGPGQERNPETNRCRSILTAASTTLSPCPVGQERNPETNRCRKVATPTTANVATITDVESIEQPSTASWLVAGGAVVAAGAYAIYEWRVDIRRKLKSIRQG
jgi:hypothetical protein